MRGSEALNRAVQLRRSLHRLCQPFELVARETGDPRIQTHVRRLRAHTNVSMRKRSMAFALFDDRELVPAERNFTG